MDKNTKKHLSHMNHFLTRVEDLLKECKTSEEFISNYKLRYPIIFGMLQIRDVASYISKEYKIEQQNINWEQIDCIKEMIGMIEAPPILVYAYEGINQLVINLRRFMISNYIDELDPVDKTEL